MRPAQMRLVTLVSNSTGAPCVLRAIIEAFPHRRPCPSQEVGNTCGAGEDCNSLAAHAVTGRGSVAGDERWGGSAGADRACLLHVAVALRRRRNHSDRGESRGLAIGGGSSDTGGGQRGCSSFDGGAQDGAKKWSVKMEAEKEEAIGTYGVTVVGASVGVELDVVIKGCAGLDPGD